MPTISVPSTQLHLVAIVGLQLTGQAPDVQVGVTIAVPSGALEFASDAVSVKLTHVQHPLVGTLVISSDNVTVTQTLIRAPPLGTLALASNAPSAEIDHFKTNSTVSVEIASDAPSALIGFTKTPSVGSLAFNGIAPTITRFVSPATGSVAFSSDTLSGGVGQRVFPSLGNISLSSDILHASPGILGTVGAVSFASSAVTLNIGNSGYSITNPDATTNVPVNYEICDLTGFRVVPGSLKLTWNKYAVRKKSWEERHPQDYLRAIPERRKKGSKRPEQDDRFIEDLYPDDVDPSTDL